jgi:hypothetical protein
MNAQRETESTINFTSNFSIDEMVFGYENKICCTIERKSVQKKRSA